MEKINKLYIAFVVSFLFWPTVIYHFMSPRIEIKNTENRILAEKPTLSIDNFYEFSQLYEEYFNDHFAFRSNLIKLNSQIDYGLFKRVDNPNVLIGKYGWLFFNPGDAASPIDNYKGFYTFSENDLFTIKNKLENFRDLLENQGIQFYLLIAPDKEQIYSEFLPDYILQYKNQSKADVLCRYLNENSDIQLIFPKEKLLDTKKDAPVYYMLDTHWNNLGGLVATQELLEKMGKMQIPLEDSPYNISAIKQGDLSNMINLSEELIESNNVSINYVDDIFIQETINGGNWQSRNYLSTARDHNKVFIIGDSFSIALIPALSHHFSDIAFNHYKEVYSYESLLAANPQIVILEIVERDSNQLFNWKAF